MPAWSGKFRPLRSEFVAASYWDNHLNVAVFARIDVLVNSVTIHFAQHYISVLYINLSQFGLDDK